MTKQKIKIRTPFNYKLEKKGYEKSDPQTETIQGDSYTIKELLDKYTHGIMPQITRLGTYPDIEDIDSLENFIITDLTDIDEAQEYIQEIKQRLQTREKKSDGKQPLKKEQVDEPNEPNESEENAPEK